MAMLYFLVNFASGVAPFLMQGLAVDIFFLQLMTKFLPLR